MSKHNTALTLAMMEGIIGGSIPQRQRRVHKRQIEYPPIGTSNKKCLGCGHKNKKCTCSVQDRKD